jgi:predicted short-subunit dehydrogenase-like oxidoreductase (DUF2520 family)
MTPLADSFQTVWVIGPGRLGLALAWQLVRSGRISTLTLVGRRPAAPRHPLLEIDPARVGYRAELQHLDSVPTAVLICVPDSAIGTVAQALADLHLPPVRVLHFSGVLGSRELSPLADAGWATGSLHPLVALADPVTSAPALRGAWYGIEGSDEALDLARAIVALLDGQTLEVPTDGKASYHAAAVFASNFLVTVLAAAERVMGSAGIAPDAAREALGRLAAGAVANVAVHGPGQALTGPIARGDAATVALHLQRLSGRDRELYSVLAAETLELARSHGLPAAAAETLVGILGGRSS